MLDTTHPVVWTGGSFVSFGLFVCKKCFVNGLCNAIQRVGMLYLGTLFSANITAQYNYIHSSFIPRSFIQFFLMNLFLHNIML